MRRSPMWIATAALFVNVLVGQVASGNAVGMTVPHGVNGPAGKGVAAASRGDTPRHDRFEAIPHAPAASNCHRDRARSDVFELQCESNTSNN